MDRRRRRLLLSGTSFSPLDFGECEIWFDVSDEKSLTYDGSLKVSDWVSNGTVQPFNIYQTTSTSQPTYDSANKVINFNGTSDYLEQNALETTGEEVLQSRTVAKTIIIAVTVPTTPVGFLYQVDRRGSTYRDYQLLFNASNQIEFFSNENSAPHIRLTGSQPSAGFHIFTLTMDSADNLRETYLYQDNQQIGYAPEAGGIAVPNTPRFTIGCDQDGSSYNNAGNFTNCGVHEFLAYKKILDSTERAKIHQYLEGKYA